MPYVGLIIGLDVALATIGKFELTLKQSVRAGWVSMVRLLLFAIPAFEEKLVVITAYAADHGLGLKTHGRGMCVQCSS